MDEEEPYCSDCGNEDDLEHLATYANGDNYRCSECGNEFIHQMDGTDW